MNDKELADAVVALGVGERYPDTKSLYWLGEKYGEYRSSYNDIAFVRLWKVVGALMETDDTRFVLALETISRFSGLENSHALSQKHA